MASVTRLSMPTQQSIFAERAHRVIESSKDLNWCPSRYVNFHRRRFAYLIRLCRELCPGQPNARVLDIGRSELTRMLAQVYRQVESLGFPLETEEGGHRPAFPLENKHHVFDLNRAERSEEWPELGQFDLIVMAEVIEHLHTAPELILTMLNSMLAENGVLIVQTPNAAALHKRLKLLIGRNPYERIRAFSANPGHFREYTRSELIEVGRAAGLKSIRHEYADYFGCDGTRMKKVVTAMYNCTFSLAPFFRRGQTVVYRASQDES